MVRSEEEIQKRIRIYEHLRKECKKLDYKPAQYWYQAKVEALRWVLGENYSRLRFVEGDEEEKRR